MASHLSWNAIIQIAGIGGIIAAIVNQVLRWWLDAFTERRKRSADTVYLAMRVVVILERFASACESHLRERDILQDTVGIKGTGQLPRLDEYPSDVDWRYFRTNFAMWALALPARIESAQNACFRAELESDNFWHSEVEALRLGLDAWLLAGKIRSFYRLGSDRELQQTADFLYAERERRESARQAANDRLRSEGG